MTTQALGCISRSCIADHMESDVFIFHGGLVTTCAVGALGDHSSFISRIGCVIMTCLTAKKLTAHLSGSHVEGVNIRYCTCFVVAVHTIRRRVSGNACKLREDTTVLRPVLTVWVRSRSIIGSTGMARYTILLTQSNGVFHTRRGSTAMTGLAGKGLAQFYCRLKVSIHYLVAVTPGAVDYVHWAGQVSSAHMSGADITMACRTLISKLS